MGGKAQKKAQEWVSAVNTTTSTHSTDKVGEYLDSLNLGPRRLVMELAFGIKMEHPDWDRERVYEEAKRLFPKPRSTDSLA